GDLNGLAVAGNYAFTTSPDDNLAVVIDLGPRIETEDVGGETIFTSIKDRETLQILTAATASTSWSPWLVIDGAQVLIEASNGAVTTVELR
ncbi:hypothetical protein KAI87_13030, partial [Myxococcota bacterium]|nr:hypothetical protein [Myxococcota bacterium]